MVGAKEYQAGDHPGSIPPVCSYLLFTLFSLYTSQKYSKFCRLRLYTSSRPNIQLAY